MKNILLYLLLIVIAAACTMKEKNSTPSFEEQVSDYLQKFPYQDTYNYMKMYTGGDPSKLNKWLMPMEPALIKAGEDVVVRSNNDTYYNMVFMDLSQGPVKLSSALHSKDRFYSFQLMDDRNTNFKNVIHPKGGYYLYYGKAPENIDGELIQAPSQLTVLIVRVEVKDKNDENDVKQASAIFKGMAIEGPDITEFPTLDLLSSYSDEVITEANRLMDSVLQTTPFREMIASPDMVPDQVSYLKLAAGTKGGWGGPLTSHSAYEVFFVDKNGNTLDGSKGNYTVTTTEPPVYAFWSVTVYDTKRGGFLHPNDENKYHINNTTAVKNADGTVTFLFKTKCEPGDLNCLEVPAGPFDLVTRYYLPHKEIRTGEWKFPAPEIIKK